MKMDVLLGMQWGDEGKGKIVDVLTPDYDLIARFQGGPNAGHTLEFDGIKHVLHTVPSGIFRESTMNLIGAGVVVDPVILRTEIEKLMKMNVPVADRLVLARKAHWILPSHRWLDAGKEASRDEKIGATLKGIGPTYMDKTGRNGLRVLDAEKLDFKHRANKLSEKHQMLIDIYPDPREDSDERLQKVIKEITRSEEEWLSAVEWILEHIPTVDCPRYVNEFLNQGKKVLAEGAQGALLDIDFGTYPYVTSSNTGTAGACIGLGVAPNRVGKVFGIMKGYTTRVGGGPFPIRIFGSIGEHLQTVGNEFGSTTGRARDCGWIDIPALKYSVQVNGITHLNITKSDVMAGIAEIQVCTGYLLADGTEVDYLPADLCEDVTPIYGETLTGWADIDWENVTSFDDLPKELRGYLRYIEGTLGIQLSIVSVGPNRTQTILTDAYQQERDREESLSA